MACTNQNQRQTSSVFADDAETDTLAENYDLYEIQESGELIVATLSGPDTYFEFRGRGFGLQHDLAESFARSIGVRLRVEVAHDTTELLTRLKNREVDLIAMKLDATKGTVSVKSHWLVSSQTPLLAESINQWYSPARLEETKKSSSTPIKARRHARPVMLDAATGTISQYDALLQRHASSIGWDWRQPNAIRNRPSTHRPSHGPAHRASCKSCQPPQPRWGSTPATFSPRRRMSKLA